MHYTHILTYQKKMTNGPLAGLTVEAKCKFSSIDCLYDFLTLIMFGGTDIITGDNWQLVGYTIS